MTTRKYETETEIEELAEGDLGWGALVRDGTGLFWLAYDTDDVPQAIRPLNEDDVQPEYSTPYTAVPEHIRSELVDLPRPLYVTTEEK